MWCSCSPGSRTRPGLRYVAPPELAITGVGLPTPSSSPLQKGGPRGVVIILQAPPAGQGRGVVLHVQRDYDDGPEGLATAIRKVDPIYDQSRDPDFRKTAIPSDPPAPETPNLGGCPMWALLVSVILLLLRQFIPDLAVLMKKAATPIAGYMRAQTNDEIARLREELAQLKQQNKPAAP